MLDNNATLTLNLEGTTSLTEPTSWPAIAVRVNENAELTIQGTGSLTAQGGSYGTGTGTITILGGTVTATAGVAKIDGSII
jgi:hypothetical protein